MEKKLVHFYRATIVFLLTVCGYFLQNLVSRFEQVEKLVIQHDKIIYQIANILHINL